MKKKFVDTILMKKSVKVSVVTFIIMFFILFIYEKYMKKQTELQCFIKEKSVLCLIVASLVYFYQETLMNKPIDVTEHLHTQAFDSFKQ